MLLETSQMELENPLSEGSNESEKVEGEDFIMWNGEEIEDFIEVEDRNGETHQYPKISERSVEGEFYRLCNQVGYYFGGEVGSHPEVTSTKFPKDHSQFPNGWIGQTEESEEISIEHAKSPKAAIFRKFGAKNGWNGADGPKSQAQDAFHEVSDYGLEVYKANFPEAAAPWTDEFDMVKVEEHAEKPWEDLYLPSILVDMFDGMPPLVRELDDEQESEEQETETETEEQETETEKQESGSDTLTVPDDATKTEQVTAILEQEPGLYDERDTVMDLVNCSKTVFYDGRNKYDEEHSTTEQESEEQEQETETETEEQETEEPETETETEQETENEVIPEFEGDLSNLPEEMQEMVAEKIAEKIVNQE